MMKRAFLLGLLLTCAALPANAQDMAPSIAPEPAWIIAITASGAQSETDDDQDDAPVFASGAVSLERRSDATWFGVSVGASDGEGLVSELDTVSDDESVFGSLWWGVALGAYDLEFSVGHGVQSYSGQAYASASAPPIVSGLVVDVDGDSQSTSLAASLSRTYGENVLITPSLTISYDETHSTVGARSSGGATYSQTTDASGMTGAVGLDISAPVSERLTLSTGGSYLYAEDAAAVGFAFSRTGGQPLTREEEGAAEWGEAYVGADLEISEKINFGVSVGTTIDREQDEAFASATLPLAL